MKKKHCSKLFLFIKEGKPALSQNNNNKKKTRVQRYNSFSSSFLLPTLFRELDTEERILSLTVVPALLMAFHNKYNIQWKNSTNKRFICRLPSRSWLCKNAVHNYNNNNNEVLI